MMRWQLRAFPSATGSPKMSFSGGEQSQVCTLFEVDTGSCWSKKSEAFPVARIQAK
jgi:hypothetical protein